MSTISEQEYITRIRQLEGLNATLAAQVDRMRPVVDAAQYWYNNGSGWSVRLADTVAIYEAQMVALAKGGQV